MTQLQSQVEIADGRLPPAPPRPPALLLLTDGAEPSVLESIAASAPPALHRLEAATLSQALELWRTGRADWAVLDLAWDSGSGLAFLNSLGSGRDRPLPVVLLVGPGQERAALEAMKLGATDYLFKADFTPAALWAKLDLPNAGPGAPRPIASAPAQTHQHYQNLVENSPDVIERFDLRLRHLYVSPALTAITGIDGAAFLGKTCRELGLDEAMVNRWEAAAARVLATGEKQTIEFTATTLSGPRHFEMSIAPERSESDQIESLLCISRDISDRVVAQQTQQGLLAAAQAAQQEAQAARDGLTRVFDRINDGIIAFDHESRCVYLNPSGEQILGRSASQLLGKLVWDEFPDAIDTPIYEVYHRALAGQQPEFLEYYLPPLDTWFEMRLYPDSDGVTIYFTDISDRKAAVASRQKAEQLRYELALLELILESILAGYWDADFVAHTTYLSPSLKRMFGYGDHELSDAIDTWQTLIVPEDLPPTLDNLSRHIQSHGEVPYYNEVRYRHKDGSIVWVICAGQVIAWDAAGQPLRMVGCHVDITQLKQTEAQLRTHQAHLQEAQRIGNLGSWEYAVATDRITWSKQVYRIFGLEVEAVPASLEALQRYFHPDDRSRHRQAIEAAVATHQPYDDDFRILRADGSQGYIHVRGEAMVDGAGQLTHLTGTVQDISDRKQVENQIQGLSLRLSLALKSGNIGSWERNLSTDEVIWDQCLVDLYGFASLGRSATYQDWRARVYADDLEEVETRHRALLNDTVPYNLEFRIWRGDGSLGWIRSSALVQRNAQGQPLSVIGINYDITEKKQAEAQLRDLSLRLDLALESGGIGTWEMDLATLEINWDQRMYAIYGLPNDGQGIALAAYRDRVYSEDWERIETTLGRALGHTAPSVLEFRVRRGDGEWRWVRGTALVQCDDRGQPQRMIGTNTDITETKRAEEELLRTTHQLEASNRELDAFAYSVSHDLRAPLRAIDGFSRALIEDYGDQFGDEGHDYFDRIRHNVGRMGQLIDDLLRLSRVSRQAMVCATVNLSALVQEQIDELRDAQPERTVAVTVAPNLTITADPTLMRVAIANLVQNAWKFTAQQPSARIEFGLERQRGEPVYYLRDNGAGFDMAYADKLFGVFQRLHNTDEFPGTGIGLATVQRAIHRQGGRVWATAAVEQGATFYFTLPQGAPGTEVQP